MAKIADFENLIKDVPIMEVTRTKHGFYLRCGSGDMALHNNGSVNLGKLSDLSTDDVNHMVQSVKPTLDDLQKGMAQYMDAAKESEANLRRAMDSRDWDTVSTEADFLKSCDIMTDKIKRSILAYQE